MQMLYDGLSGILPFVTFRLDPRCERTVYELCPGTCKPLFPCFARWMDRVKAAERFL